MRGGLGPRRRHGLLMEKLRLDMHRMGCRRGSNRRLRQCAAHSILQEPYNRSEARTWCIQNVIQKERVGKGDERREKRAQREIRAASTYRFKERCIMRRRQCNNTRGGRGVGTK
jgi:hypothetical protein